ncbi:MAG: glycoside hydrolase family 127 protein, partial [Bryobacter sp.]|nr:glycoside hydrolase family 127 protein [Bryobacter sp.]
MRLILLCAAVGLLGAADWRDQGVIHLADSPHAQLHPVPVRAVKMEPGFWRSRMEVNASRSIPTLLELLEQHGAIDNYLRLTGRKDVPRRGPLYTDSDLYKWIEAAAWVLHDHDDPALRAKIDALTEVILETQEPSGYLNTWFTGDRERLRFQQMQSGHELYCLGHWIQAAIACYRATGNRRLLDGATKFADYLVRDFGPAPKRPLLTGHPELELALVELYRTTGRKQYLDLAGYLLSGVEKDRLKLTPRDITYMFSGVPFTSRTQFEGHAVRAMYASSGAADYYLETGDPAYRKTLDLLWDDLTRRKMYVTGGVGSRAQGEAFGEAYELPNYSAYTESCAAIGSYFFNHRLLHSTGDAKYAAVMERALYNGINSGMSLDGTLYCYRNPLASRGEKIRNPWYDTTCCPPNLQRVFASLPGYFYSTSKAGLYVHFYDNNRLEWKLESGTPITVRQETGFPWRGRATLTLTTGQGDDFTLFLRIPEWSAVTRITVNGTLWTGPAKPNTYAALKRRWMPGDKVTLDFDMRPQLVTANARVPEAWGRAAVQRGPFLYCAEQEDNPAPIPDLGLSRL